MNYSKETEDFFECLEKISLKYGIDIIYNPLRIRSLLYDLVPKAQKQSKIFINVICDSEFIEKIYLRKVSFKFVVQNIKEKNGLSDEWAECIAIAIFRFFGYPMECVESNDKKETISETNRGQSEKRKQDLSECSSPNIGQEKNKITISQIHPEEKKARKMAIILIISTVGILLLCSELNSKRDSDAKQGLDIKYDLDDLSYCSNIEEVINKFALYFKEDDESLLQSVIFDENDYVVEKETTSNEIKTRSEYIQALDEAYGEGNWWISYEIVSSGKYSAEERVNKNHMYAENGSDYHISDMEYVEFKIILSSNESSTTLADFTGSSAVSIGKIGDYWYILD